jgi:hypothetical protein
MLTAPPPPKSLKWPLSVTQGRGPDNQDSPCFMHNLRGGNPPPHSRCQTADFFIGQPQNKKALYSIATLI